MDCYFVNDFRCDRIRHHTIFGFLSQLGLSQVRPKDLESLIQLRRIK